MNETTEDAALEPAAMLRLAERQQDDIQRRMAAGVPSILATWGTTWFLGFLAFWLVDGLAPAFALDGRVAIAVLAVLWIGAIVVSIVQSMRINRGLQGTSANAWTGIVYGISWMLMIVIVAGVYIGLSVNGLDQSLGELYFPVAISAGVGLLYVIGGGIWRAGLMIGMGLVIIAGALAAPFFGAPGHFLVLAISGGATFAVGALLTRRFTRQAGA